MFICGFLYWLIHTHSKFVWEFGIWLQLEVRWPFGPAFGLLWNLQHPWILSPLPCCFCLRGEPPGDSIGRKTPLVKVQMATWSMSSWQVGPTGPKGALSVNCCLLSQVFGAVWLPSSSYLMGPTSVNQRLQTLSPLCTLSRAPTLMGETELTWKNT